MSLNDIGMNVYIFKKYMVLVLTKKSNQKLHICHQLPTPGFMLNPMSYL